MMTSNIALKEWAAVVEALSLGQQLLLLRKGGIRDAQGAFMLDHSEFLLYPTFEHQSEGAIREEFRSGLKPLLEQPVEQAQVSLHLYGGVAHVGQATDPKQLEGLESYHIWTPEFIKKRMSYRPESPTLVVMIRAYRLKEPVEHPVDPAYAGCHSWVPLTQFIPVENLEPVMDNQKFRSALREISSRLGA